MTTVSYGKAPTGTEADAGTVTEAREEQPTKASSPIEVTDAGMATKEATHTRVRRHCCALLMAQQIDDQDIRLGHERLESRDGFRS